MIYRIVSTLQHLGQIAHNNIWSRYQCGCSRPERAMEWRHRDRFDFAIDQRLDLERLHHRAERDFSNWRTGFLWVAQSIGKFFLDEQASTSDAQQLRVSVVVVLVSVHVEKVGSSH